MTLRKWVLLVLFVLGFMWVMVYYPEPILRSYCPVASLLLIFAGAYGLWTARLVDEFGVEFKRLCQKGGRRF